MRRHMLQKGQNPDVGYREKIHPGGQVERIIVPRPGETDESLAERIIAEHDRRIVEYKEVRSPPYSSLHNLWPDCLLIFSYGANRSHQHM
jgi:hypothetical protein